MWQEARAGRRLRRREPVPAQHRRLHRHVQPVRQHQRGGPDPATSSGERTGWTSAPGTIGLILALGNIGVLLGRADRRPAGEGDRHRADDHRHGGASVASRRSPSRSRRSDDPFWFLVIGGIIVGFTHGRLQRQPGRPATGDHARPYAWAHERDDAPHRVGHDPDRRAHRRHPRHASSGCSPALWVSAIGACLAFLPGPLLAREEPARDPGPGRMTLEAPMRCSALAEQLGEPMIGTRRPAASLAAGRGSRARGASDAVARRPRRRLRPRRRRRRRPAAAARPASRGRPGSRCGAPRHPGRHRDRARWRCGPFAIPPSSTSSALADDAARRVRRAA